MNLPGTSALPELAPSDRRGLLSSSARQLARKHGKQPYYDAIQVSAAVARAGFPATWTLHALSVFGTDTEFAAHCALQGVQADYAQTRAAALRALSIPPQASGQPAAMAAAGLLAAGLAANEAMALDGSGQSRWGETLDNIGTAFDGLELIGDLFDFLGSL